MVAQLAQPETHAPLDGAQRQAQALGHLPLRQAGEVDQRDGLALTARDVPEGFAQPIPPVVGPGLGEGLAGLGPRGRGFGLLPPPAAARVLLGINVSFGGPAASLLVRGPWALRPRLATGLPFSTLWRTVSEPGRPTASAERPFLLGRCSIGYSTSFAGYECTLEALEHSKMTEGRKRLRALFDADPLRWRPFEGIFPLRPTGLAAREGTVRPLLDGGVARHLLDGLRVGVAGEEQRRAPVLGGVEG